MDIDKNGLGKTEIQQQTHQFFVWHPNITPKIKGGYSKVAETILYYGWDMNAEH